MRADAVEHPFGRRCRWVAGLLLAGFGALALRLIWVQVVEHPKWSHRAAQQEFTQVTIPAERGAIFDRNGRRLATSRDVWSVWADPKFVEDAGATAGALARELGLEEAQVRARLEQPRRFVWLKRKVGAPEAEAVRRLDLAGVGLQRESLRTYPEGVRACHVLGFVNIDNIGQEGLEARFDALLRGADGAAILRVDGRRRPICDASMPIIEPQHGENLVLTLDANIQAICEEELEAAVRRWRAKSGVSIVMDPCSGDVLALACLPNFDPNHFSECPADARRNRAVVDYYEPGSSLKPVVAAAVLETGLAAPTTRFDCHMGEWRVGSRVLHDVHGYGMLTLVEVVEKSSNIGIAQVAALLGPRGLYQTVRAFGFGEPTGIELPGETAGMVHPLRYWTSYSMTSVPMGQEIGVSALQLARAFCVFANGGYLVSPRLVAGSVTPDGMTLREHFGRPAPRRVLSRGVAEFMARQVLAGVVERGTGKAARLAGYSVGGKTGTAQVTRPGGRGYEPGAYIGTFVGFAPVEAPRFVVLVSLERPVGTHYGGTVAAPTVARILERSLAYAGVPPRVGATAMR